MQAFLEMLKAALLLFALLVLYSILNAFILGLDGLEGMSDGETQIYFVSQMFGILAFAYLLYRTLFQRSWEKWTGQGPMPPGWRKWLLAGGILCTFVPMGIILI
ncbi:hypothetical protein [Alkalicoccus urumqiensis]|uniref:CPBP family intramembrane metalloprotease n=1 Tax=Alkalicoccus urumqiensis TaxID=1548213 RepID=A0A2P6MI73_ALKUR|nr:hypothetical protein [Alkalicoccus urumqiensis]PRO65982.1 hypothetical protein C6I21_06670 [Alkalicoccus urumqiensis]